MKVRLRKSITVYNPTDFMPHVVGSVGEEYEVEEVSKILEIDGSKVTLFVMKFDTLFGAPVEKGKGIPFRSKESLFECCEEIKEGK
jgi:hypothetical protein